jgi:hypothetical protein
VLHARLLTFRILSAVWYSERAGRFDAFKWKGRLAPTQMNRYTELISVPGPVAVVENNSDVLRVPYHDIRYKWYPISLCVSNVRDRFVLNLVMNRFKFSEQISAMFITRAYTKIFRANLIFIHIGPAYYEQYANLSSKTNFLWNDPSRKKLMLA